MLRDFKFLRRNSGKNNSEDAENVPVNPRDALNPQTSADPSRPPLNTIQEPSRIPRAVSEHEFGSYKRKRVDRTPTKPKPKHPDMLRTPEKQGLLSRNRFNWDQRGDYASGNSGLESREGGRVLFSNVVDSPSSTRAVARANLSYSECNSTQSTPTKSVSKPPNPGFALASSSRTVANTGSRMANYGMLTRGIPSSCNLPTVVNTVEVPYFELKEDPSFWMEHNVQVLIRIRPLNNMEKSSFGYSRCLKQESAQSITWIGQQPETRFMFDHVACETIDQETLFRMVGLPMVENCLSGYNSCMFAYGQLMDFISVVLFWPLLWVFCSGLPSENLTMQTGSGKTYTMLGEMDELEVRPSPHRGMTPRIFEFLFARIRAEEESRRDERLKYNCKCSFLEIYNEQITDLLDPSSTNLMLREDMQKGVYVENLSEFEVHTVGDILQLLSQGSSNRKVAATNMNRESSRSHSVFTCVIESRWEKDSTTNFRFARLNLVDLAGSERQKSSGAEGERLKEAANINKSLSTLGHVIMVLVDVANGKPRHIPYRDSRLTFLLQDSLGGNSKTMIIANVSPSLCSAAETYNTLKFAQRAKLIQNNAVINEDSSGDVVALKRQIQLLKEELSALKREKVSRSLSFGPATDTRSKDDDDDCNERSPAQETHGVLRVSCKQVKCAAFNIVYFLVTAFIQLKSLETTLAGALRREQMADATVQQLQAEIQQLNRLVTQREEDTRCTKMMLKFREDKIQRMESVLGKLISTDDYLVKENHALQEEIQVLRERMDKNPEVTRFALENIRLLDQVRQFQDLYEEGEREMLMTEVSELRNQLISSLDGNLKHPNLLDMKAPKGDESEKDLLHKELNKTLFELEDSKEKLNSCLEENAKLRRELEELQASVSVTSSAVQGHDYSAEVIKESIVEVPTISNQAMMTAQREKEGTKPNLVNAEDIMNLQLELDIVKIILHEQRSSHTETEAIAKSLNEELHLAKEMVISVSKDYERVQEELTNAKLVIEALESQQLQSINEIEDIKSSNVFLEELLKEKELEISNLKGIAQSQDSRDISMYNKHAECDDSPLEAKLKKMHQSLEKARKLNELYKNDLAYQATHENEAEEVRKQVEAETAEVIVCLQEELSGLQQEVYDSKTKEMEAMESLKLLQAQMKIMENDLLLKNEDNVKLSKQLEKMRSEWDLIASEIEDTLSDGNVALADASEEIGVISSSIPFKRSIISEQFGRIRKYIYEKELSIEELNQCLKDALERRDDMECMLRSLRGAALVMTETHQQECSEKDREILHLTSNLNSMKATVDELRRLVEHGKYQLKTASSCATAAFVIVNRLSELNSNYRDALNYKDAQMGDGIDISETRGKLKELNSGVSVLRACVNEYKSRTGTRIEEDDAGSCDIGGGNLKPARTVESVNGGDSAVVLLKKEIECSLKSLQVVQAEMDRLCCEKEEILASEKCGQKSIESMVAQVVILGDAIENFRDEVEVKINDMESKLGNLEEIIQESFTSWFQQRELLEDELDDAKVIAAQKTIEASCILEKFEEVQDTVKEADIMINELMIANEALKLNTHELKVNENDLLKEVESLKLSNSLKDQKCGNLEKQYSTDFDIMKTMLSELEDVITGMKNSYSKEWMPVSRDILNMKSQFHEFTVSIRTMLEDVWSDIIVKDCAVSVLHLCHMGILLETANGLNAENGLLEHGLCESNSIVSELREHNLKARKELELCRELKGKLLVDIRKGFDRISSKVDENGEVTLKLASFEKKIQNLQFQEEMMLQRSNDMGCELAVIMKELDFCNKNTTESIMVHERLLKEKDELLQHQEESFMLELHAKEFELLILWTESKQLSVQKADLVNACISACDVLEELKKDIVFKSIEAVSGELMLLEKESALEGSSSHISKLYEKIQKLQNELESKNEELGRISCLEKENEKLHELVIENQTLRNNVLMSENCIAELEEDIRLAKVEIQNHKVSQCIVKDELCSRIEDLEREISNLNTSKEENILLRNEVRALDVKLLKNVESAKTADKAICDTVDFAREKIVEVECKFQNIVNEMDRAQNFLEQIECVETIALQLDSETLYLQMELLRKDDILKGLLFDLSLLQESASNSKDKKDEMEEVLASLRAVEKDLELTSHELQKALAEGQALDVQLHEKMEAIVSLELDLNKSQEMVNSLTDRNANLLDGVKEALEAKNSMEKELLETRTNIKNLEMEVGEMEMALDQMSKTTELLKCNLASATCQRDELEDRVDILTRELEMARNLAGENEAIAAEAQELAEMQKAHAEEKEEEVKLLERSIEELECTVNVLEQKVDIVKGEAERQRLQREELELELLGIKEQMQNIKSNDSDLKRCLDEKEKDLAEALQRVQLLEREIAARDAEISQCNDHISELNLHAEAQASEYKKKFKALETMVEQLKSETATHSTASPKKLEKSVSKPRGSGSPFKCIGLGLAQQIKSEKDEELTAGRQRIEELEVLAASRQKEILLLKARLASTESMTHDVIRDLLGVKMNMKNYANIMDNQKLHSLTAPTQQYNVESGVKEQELANLKQQIHEFVKERNGWLEEIEKKQAEMMAAHIALEKLRQQEQLLSSENEMLKMENANHKKKVMDLEVEEENNLLRSQNEDLSVKLRKTEAVLSRVKEELAQYRKANGKNPYINFDEEEQLDKKLKETEEEKLRLAQKLLGLCTTVLKAAGITRPTSEISLSVAEDALMHLKNRVVSLEMELEDVKLKNRISDERIRLSELRPQTPTASSPWAPFLSAFDR
ncbi:kinesin motor family protein [Striga asiatica]|uniref:Kinesin motor family protein n=1 Tax=Striga asiatica TaxID=4170 RepID=A0A5A7QZ75_STRAF|nr:kinesin motor family protein [Striga asiatica]